MTILLYELVGQDSSRPFSPHCWKAAMALAHKGLDFGACRRLSPMSQRSKAVCRKPFRSSATATRFVADSFAIALYLDEAYPDRPTLFGGRRQGYGAVHRTLVAADHPSYLGRLDGHPCRAWPAGQGLFPRQPREALRQEARRGFGRARSRACGFPRFTRAAAQHAGLPAIHRRHRRSLPTISSSARSSGSASCLPFRCWPKATRWRNGSSAASICMAGSAAA